MAKIDTLKGVKHEFRKSMQWILTPFERGKGDDDPTVPAIFAIVIFGTYVASLWLLERHWVLLLVFAHYLYLLVTKTKIPQTIYVALRCLLGVPVLLTFLSLQVLIGIPLLKLHSRYTSTPEPEEFFTYKGKPLGQ
ncbi:MAG: hypothetical protein P8J01_04945 [Acidimicrobiales bacterium]|nr:hypothetical protein [Acidimicrobiales bacterium]